MCIRIAGEFRDRCLHTDRDKYEALVAKLNKLPLKTSRLAIALWTEIERIKNLHNGHKPSGRTFRAWRSPFDASPATRHPSLAKEAA